MARSACAASAARAASALLRSTGFAAHIHGTDYITRLHTTVSRVNLLAVHGGLHFSLECLVPVACRSFSKFAVKRRSSPNQLAAARASKNSICGLQCVRNHRTSNLVQRGDKLHHQALHVCLTCGGNSQTSLRAMQFVPAL